MRGAAVLVAEPQSGGTSGDTSTWALCHCTDGTPVETAGVAAAELAARGRELAPAGPVLVGLGGGPDDLAALHAALLDTGAPDVVLWPDTGWSRARLLLAPVDLALLDAETAAERLRSGGDPARIRRRLMAVALWRLAAADGLAELAAPGLCPLGRGSAAVLRRAVPSSLVPPRLKNDCFAMPQGVDWVPVDDALARLRASVQPVTEIERVSVANALGRSLATACVARRANPPAANAAVDGYGFTHEAIRPGTCHLPLIPGRAAAGQPFEGTVPQGAALRILTGAILPEGVDTVVLEEDTDSDGATLAFDGGLRAGANTRCAGEDVASGAPVLAAGHVLRPPDLALLTAVGLGEVAVWRRLRVAVLSTGDELADPGDALDDPHRIPDANRPMLLALAARWGHATLDLGRAPDDPAEIAARLDLGARDADVILTSGGASAGEEDYISRLIRDRGTVTSWRIAVKPGRPLALGLWNTVPVFGLPGNPVAAFVCTLVFARPALGLMAGTGWQEPLAMTVPAAFTKSKKAGRREYLRARLDPEGAARVFPSEGSGRISGLAWATGLVELPDAAIKIAPGAPVRFLPYAGFGL